VSQELIIQTSKRKDGRRHRYTLLGGEIQLLVLDAPNSANTRATGHRHWGVAVGKTGHRWWKL
jgi:hypothetical protein